MSARAKLQRSAASVAAVAATTILLAACGGSGSEEGSAPAATPAGAAEEFSTDFSTHSVPLEEFQSGGPPKDGIPTIDDPQFVAVADAGSFLDPDEPVAVLERGGETHAYPIQILVWHEIVNDEVGGEPVTVTYCPLCNSTVAFSREVDGRVLDFGTTGRLRKSDLVMYDRQTESWWQQLTAEAVVGDLTGAELEVLPAQILPWGEVERAHPDAAVLSRETGFDRDYGASPYPGYDDPDSEPFLLEEEADGRLPPKQRVATIQTGEETAVVYPFPRLERQAPVNDEIDGRAIVVMFDPGVTSALDAAEVADGRDAGASAVFERRLGGRELSFQAGPDPGTSRDRETGSTWDLSGRATRGPLEGRRLEQIPSDDQFWFALAAFFPEAEIREGP